MTTVSSGTFDGCSSGSVRNFATALFRSSQQLASSSVRPAAITRWRSLFSASVHSHCLQQRRRRGYLGGPPRSMGLCLRRFGPFVGLQSLLRSPRQRSRMLPRQRLIAACSVESSSPFPSSSGSQTVAQRSTTRWVMVRWPKGLQESHRLLREIAGAATRQPARQRHDRKMTEESRSLARFTMSEGATRGRLAVTSIVNTLCRVRHQLRTDVLPLERPQRDVCRFAPPVVCLRVGTDSVGAQHASLKQTVDRYWRS